MTTDTMKLVLKILGAIVLLAVGGIIGLAATDTDVPDVLATISVASVTGMLGLLVVPIKDEPPPQP